MMATIELGDVVLEVIRKKIKNVHLSVHPPTGAVRIAAPLRMPIDTIRLFAISKLGWIRRQQQKLQGQEREAPREYLDRESHYVWGRRYLLAIQEEGRVPAVELNHSRLVMRVRPGASREQKQALLEEWYRQQLKAMAAPMIRRWEPVMGVRVRKFFVQRMKTRWGSCNPAAATIRLNTELAKKPLECLEYIVVHEMAHLLEPTHNKRFQMLMESYMPLWDAHRDILNRLPVRYQ